MVIIVINLKVQECVIKQKLMFENFKDCLLNNKNVYRSQRFKSYNKRLQTFDRITTYPYETNTFKVC